MNRAYIRTSTGAQDIETQRHAINRYLENKGIKDCEFYIDRSRSGKRVDRPELARLLKELQPDDLLVVTELSRFTRMGIGDMVITVNQIIKELKANLVALDQGWDFGSPEGQLLTAIYGYLANKEWEAARERNLRMISARKAAGVKFGRKTKLSEEQARTAASMFKRGFRTKEIEKTFSVSRQVIYNALRRYGFAVSGRREQFKEQLNDGTDQDS